MALARSDARTASRQSRKTTPRPEPPKRKRRPGRPSKYKPEFAEQVTNYCLLGATNAELAGIFGVDERTIYDWLATKPDFSQALKNGREIADAKVAHSLYQRALSGDVTACIFWLKNRRPHEWRDKKEVDSTSTVRGERKVTYELSPEARAILDETLAELGQPLYEPPAKGNGSRKPGNGTKH